MANKPTGRGLYIRENPDADECCENIPPGGTVKAGTSKLKWPHEENKPLSDTCTFSTPAPTGSKPKSRISFQSALTPILKYLNIGNKSPESSTHENNRRQTLSLFSFGAATADCQKSTKGSVQQLNSDPPSSYSGQLFSDMDGPVSFLGDECLPEVTLFDSMCDSAIQLTRNDSPAPDSAPATSASTSPKINIPEIHPPDLSQHMATTEITDPDVKMIDASQNKHAPVPWLILDKFLPEITLLDVTRDSPLSSGQQTFSMDVTQALPPLDLKRDRSFNGMESGKIAAQPSSSGVISGKKLLSTSVQSDKCVGESIAKTSLGVTQDITMGSVLENSKSSSEPSECNIETSQASAGDTLGKNPAKVTREIISSSDIPADSNVECSANQKATSEIREEPVEFSDKPQAIIKDLIASHEAKSANEPSGQNMKMSSTSPDDTFSSQPANVTHDTTSSNDTSAQSVRSTSNMECSSSQKDPPSELVESCHKVNDELKNYATQPNPKASNSGNGTFNVMQAADLSVSNDLNTTASVSHIQNKTLDLPPFNVSCTKDGTSGQAGFGTTETSPITNQNCSSLKECAPFAVQNTTFEKHSLHKSSGSTVLGEDLKNNTFDSQPPSKKSDTITLLETVQSESSQIASKPNSTITLTEMSSCDGHQSASKPNGTITLSEVNPNDSHHNTSRPNGTITLSETSSCTIRPRSSDKPSTPEVSNLTTSPKDNNIDIAPDLSKHNVTTDAKDHSGKDVETHDDASGSGSCETKDLSGLPVVGGLSDSLNSQSFGTVNLKAKCFNLDDTLDLKADCLITSTPMTKCTMFNLNTEQVEGLHLGAQKKLYTDGPRKPADQVPSDPPSNLVCDRKTFLKQPAAKSLCPPPKAGAQLMKSKSHSSIPARLNTVASNLPTKRQRTQAEASRNTAATAPDAPQGTTGVTSCYNLRATATGSKLPACGSQRSQFSGIPSGIQRATMCLRPPLTRSSTAISSSTDKLCGPTATNPVTKTSQAKKHPLTRADSLLVSKRKKMDASDPCNSVGAPVSACDATNKTTILKQPSKRGLPAKAQGEGCAKCAELEEQLKLISEENTRLKEELLKYTKQDVPVKSRC
ncbi:mucin-17 isoform X2 [Haplochromis burtoni]|uniref:mucin-17 isoform X2 n=1 Tax=Haplochromis burtoni TaxID=8153 RepID=UPI001C2DCFA2|nr:mucin-17 isoform X2 [Haplochromis burtoni]